MDFYQTALRHTAELNTICSIEFTEFFWTFFIVLYSKKHDVSKSGSVSILR
jgi:hypothetical protein